VLVVDFAPHALEFLREEHAHRRLGFSDREVASWFRASGLTPAEPRVVPGQPLNVVLWLATRTPGLVRPSEHALALESSA
jgi:ArsR family transcriptional regulator